MKDSVTAGIASVLQAIQSMQTSVVNVQDSVNALGASGQSNARFTPPIAVIGPDYAICFVTNVSTASRDIDTKMLDSFGNVVEHFALTMQPGTSENPVVHQAVGPGDFYSCRFTVTNGSRTDIRAAILNGTSTSVTLEVSAE